MTDPPTRGSQRHYELLPERTAVSFRTRHLFGLGVVRGRVALVGGRAVVDPEDGALLQVDADLDMRTFESGSARRDAAVASRRLLDSATHQRATYRSTSVERRPGGGWRVHGRLTARGIAAPVDVLVDAVDLADDVGVRARARVDRRLHGITIPGFLAGRFLEISVDGHGRRSDVPLPVSA